MAAGHGRYELPIAARGWRVRRLTPAFSSLSGWIFAAGHLWALDWSNSYRLPVIFNPDAPHLDTRAALPDLSADEQARLAELREAAKTPELVAEQTRAKAVRDWQAG